MNRFGKEERKILEVVESMAKILGRIQTDLEGFWASVGTAKREIDEIISSALGRRKK